MLRRPFATREPAFHCTLNVLMATEPRGVHERSAGEGMWYSMGVPARAADTRPTGRAPPRERKRWMPNARHTIEK